MKLRSMLQHVMQEEQDLLQLESATSESTAREPASAASGPPSPSKTPPPPSSTHAASAPPAAGTYLTVAGHLGRLTLLVSARTADEFWPPAEVAPQPPPSSRRSLGLEHSLLLSTPQRDIVTVADERPLIAIVSEGGLMRYAQVRLVSG
jgi:hypothetical protein